MLRFLPRAGFSDTRVLLRVDFNVPIRSRRVLDAFDIGQALPTIRKLLKGRNVIILISHHSDDRQSLAPLAPFLSRRLKRPVAFLRNPLGAYARSAVRRARPGAVFLCENVRFWRGERQSSPLFARSLALLGEVFVNEAFGELHRPYATMVGIPRYLPSFAGPLIRAELEQLDGFLRPRGPLVVIIGGAKLDTKLRFLERFAKMADWVLVGGEAANTLLAARGLSIGRSIAAPDHAAVRRLSRSRRIVVPVDALVARGRQARSVPVTAIGSRDRIADIGSDTRRLFSRIIRSARTVVWNGPLGLVEDARFTHGTRAVVRALARHGGAVLIGGGDTVAFLHRTRLQSRRWHVSTGGGAMLAYLAGETLPGLEALKRSKHES